MIEKTILVGVIPQFFFGYLLIFKMLQRIVYIFTILVIWRSLYSLYKSYNIEMPCMIK